MTHCCVSPDLRKDCNYVEELPVNRSLMCTHTCTHLHTYKHTHNTHTAHTHTYPFPCHVVNDLSHVQHKLSIQKSNPEWSHYKSSVFSWKVGKHFLCFSNQNSRGPHHQAFQTQPLALRQKKKKCHVRSSTLLCLGRADWCSVHWLTRKCCATLDPPLSFLNKLHGLSSKTWRLGSILETFHKLY